MRSGHLLSFVAALSLAGGAHGSTPPSPDAEDMAGRLERQFGIREPPWTGSAPAKGSPSYEEALAALRSLLERRPSGVRDRLTTAAPCILRLVSAFDFAARAPSPSIGLRYSSTWIDLRRVTGIAAEALGRTPNPDVPTFLATCAFFRGAPEFAQWTEVRACTDLAASFALGRGVPPDPARVEALRKKVCDLGDQRACVTPK